MKLSLKVTGNFKTYQGHGNYIEAIWCRVLTERWRSFGCELLLERKRHQILTENEK